MDEVVGDPIAQVLAVQDLAANDAVSPRWSAVCADKCRVTSGLRPDSLPQGAGGPAGPVTGAAQSPPTWVKTCISLAPGHPCTGVGERTGSSSSALENPRQTEGGEHMKKLEIRMAGPVRLTAAACSIYKVPK